MGCLANVNLFLRVLSFVCLATSVTILTTSSSDMSVASVFHGDVEVKYRSTDFYAYSVYKLKPGSLGNNLSTSSEVAVWTAYILPSPDPTLWEYTGYMLACSSAGFVYSLLQTAIAIIQFKTGDCISDKLSHFDVYADKIMSMIVGTGAAAGFGLTVDLNRLPNRAMVTVDFLNKENAAASFCIVGFACNMISSFISLKIFKDEYLYDC